MPYKNKEEKRRKDREYYEAIIKPRMQQGFCVCGQKAVNDTRCQRCAEKHIEYLRKRRDGRRQAKLCVHCAKPVSDDNRLCDECQKKSREYHHKLRFSALDEYGKKCACCGEARLEFLCIDHINGGGRQHMLKIKKSIFLWLRQNGYPPGFQTLCWSCNAAKHIYGECPHQRERRESDYVI